MWPQIRLRPDTVHLRPKAFLVLKVVKHLSDIGTPQLSQGTVPDGRLYVIREHSLSDLPPPLIALAVSLQDTGREDGSAWRDAQLPDCSLLRCPFRFGYGLGLLIEEIDPSHGRRGYLFGSYSGIAGG